ncbi:MAG TPA: D-lysine 5,6-aminomutase subunit alpha [Firmicutes bacterium]|nr:D-lysine 5,6-aminomutase subunit alpha [Bacillota bacterium]
MKLDLDISKIHKCRECANDIADQVMEHVQRVTTTTIERTVLRLLGVDGVNHAGVPLPNVVVDSVHRAGHLEDGIATYMARAVASTGLSPQQVAEKVACGELDLTLTASAPAGIGGCERSVLSSAVSASLDRILANVATRREYLSRLDPGTEPLIYVIVATGNIYEDVEQAQSAAKAGADIIAVIRSTAQSLLDYVPYGATTEGFGGTFATQENFRIMRRGLDSVSVETGRYIRLVNYCSGLCMPEIAAMGALERLDMMLNDSMYGILFRDINMKRTFADQHFSRMINAYAGITINTGEDNYLTTADAYDEAHTVLASQFINEALAHRSGLPDSQIGLGHAFEINPELKDGFLYEVAQAQLARDIFPDAPLKYMPPTKYMTGDIFRGYLLNGMFNLAGVMTGQSIQLLGMLTEAIHTPHIHDRYLATKNAKHVFNNARHLGDDILYTRGGIIQTRAEQVLDDTARMLQHVRDRGLMNAMGEGIFAGIARTPDGGRGLDGVAAKSADYWNPFEEAIASRLALAASNDPRRR